MVFIAFNPNANVLWANIVMSFTLYILKLSFYLVIIRYSVFISTSFSFEANGKHAKMTVIKV
jgi:hypothetical protein